MLSILIPTYNFDITKLVKTLHQQCSKLDIVFEILCFDDGSQLEHKTRNQAIKQLANVSYRELENNLGRAKIRNLLATKAKYAYLLFMDCDSAVSSDAYIKNYVNHLNQNTLLYGGRIYSVNPPKFYEKKLHYFFGKHREEILTEERKIKPYYSFMTNNFLIPKAIFLQIQFDETIEGYGHEDTLFGIALKNQGIKIVHINNPLEHLGLENRDVFLEKQKEAIYNAFLLHKKIGFKETKLLQTFVWCKKWQIKELVFQSLKMLYPIISNQLKAAKPKMFYLDLYKLYHLLKLDKLKT